MPRYLPDPVDPELPPIPAPPVDFGRLIPPPAPPEPPEPPLPTLPARDEDAAGDEQPTPTRDRGDVSPDEPHEPETPNEWDDLQDSQPEREGAPPGPERGPMPREQTPHPGPAIYDVYGRRQAPGGPSPRQLAAQQFQQQMNSLPAPMRAQLMYEMTKLSIGEQLHKQRLEQGMAHVDQQDYLSADEKAALKMQMVTGLNQFKIREMKAHALMQEMNTQKMQEAVTQQHALETTLNAQREKFAALSKKSADGSFEMPGLHGRFQINRHGEAELIKDMTHKDNAAEAKAEHSATQQHKDWVGEYHKVAAAVDKEIAAEKKRIDQENAARTENGEAKVKQAATFDREAVIADRMRRLGLPGSVEEFQQSQQKSAQPPPPPPGGPPPVAPGVPAPPQPAPTPPAAPAPIDPAKRRAQVVQKFDDFGKDILDVSDNALRPDDKADAARIVKSLKPLIAEHGSIEAIPDAWTRKKATEDMRQLAEYSAKIAAYNRLKKGG